MKHPQSSNYPKQMFLGMNEPKPNKIDQIENSGRNGGIHVKPIGGLWTSTLREDGSSEWLEWCKREQWGIGKETKAWILKPREDVDVLTIDSMNDLKALLKEFPRDDPFSQILPHASLNFEEIVSQTDYDGVRLTKKGQQQTRLSHPNLYGWDSESTIWFNWCFSDVAYYTHIGEEIKW